MAYPFAIVIVPTTRITSYIAFSSISCLFPCENHDRISWNHYCTPINGLSIRYVRTNCNVRHGRMVSCSTCHSTCMPSVRLMRIRSSFHQRNARKFSCLSIRGSLTVSSPGNQFLWTNGFLLIYARTLSDAAPIIFAQLLIHQRYSRIMRRHAWSDLFFRVIDIPGLSDRSVSLLDIIGITPVFLRSVYAVDYELSREMKLTSSPANRLDLQ